MKRIFALLLLICVLAQAHGAEVKLKVATYNIKGLPFPIQPIHTSRYRKMVREIRSMDKEGTAPDVILVQEAFSVFTGYLYRKLRDIYPYRVRGPRNRIRWNSGLEILSRFPITKSSTVAFDTCDSFDCLSRKGVLFARIDVGGSQVDLYNTHMQANNAGRSDSISERVRDRQTETMIDFIKRTRAPELPFFLAGDFNSRPSARNYARFPEEFGDIDTRVFCQTSNACPGFGNYSDDIWNTRIDHVFYGQGEARVLPLDYEIFFRGRKFSDHDLILGTYLVEF